MSPTWKIALAFTGLFLAGAITGSLITLRTVRHHAVRPVSGIQQSSPDKFVESQIKQLSRKLKLSEAQQEQITPIIRKSGEQLQELRRLGIHESMSVFGKMNAQIEALLSAEQKQRFQELCQRRHDRFKKFATQGLQNPPFPPPPHKRAEHED